MPIKGNLLTSGGIIPERAEALSDLSVSPAVSKWPELSRNSVISVCVKIRRWEMASSEGPISPNPFILLTRKIDLSAVHMST